MTVNQDLIEVDPELSCPLEREARFTVRTINPSDFDFIIDLAATEGIKYAKQDLSRILDYEPDGCFIAVKGEKRLGIVSTIVFGKVGWIGNLFVAKAARRRGAGTKLVKEALGYMQSKGVEFPKLYCFPHNIRFYRRLGFVTELNIQVFGGTGRAAPFTNVEELREGTLNELIALDERLFGANRRKMLCRLHKEFREYCFGAYVNKRLVGYVMASGSGGEYELGPWVCEPQYQNEFAEDLLKAEIARLEGEYFELSSPMHNVVAERILESTGLEKKRVAVRMGYGREVSIGKIEGILGIGGLDRG